MPASYDFYRMVAERLNSTPKTVQKFCDGIIDELAAELYVRGTVYVPYLGTFWGYQVEEKLGRQKINGVEQVYKIPEHIKPKFTPCDDFINHSNYAGVTKAYRKRARHKELTKRDVAYLSKMKAAKLIEKMDKADGDKARADFAEFLERRKENHYEIITNQNEDEKT